MSYKCSRKFYIQHGTVNIQVDSAIVIAQLKSEYWNGNIIFIMKLRFEKCMSLTCCFVTQVVAIGKKLLVMQWRHSAAWTAWCPASDTDTVDGFQYIRVSKFLSTSPTLYLVNTFSNNTET
jgi:hypothetical protein